MNTSITNESLVSTGSYWFPAAHTAVSPQVDHLYYWILWASVAMFIAILAVVGYFLYKFKRTPQNLIAQDQITENHTIELAWTIIPTIVVMFVFYAGYKGYLHLTVPPANATEIHVVGKKWMWQFEYKNGIKTIGELVVPVNEPIKLIMTSEDVVHSFFVPNFRIKRDVIPNRYTREWFKADKPGNYQIFCTEYCGDGHSNMLASVRVMTPADYEKWQKEQNSGADLPLDALGEKVYNAKGCATCHSIDGSAKTGPTWKGIYGASHKMSDGKVVTVDDNYIKESVLDPKAKVVAGFSPVMPTFAGLLSEREINGIIEYLKKLK